MKKRDYQNAILNLFFAEMSSEGSVPAIVGYMRQKAFEMGINDQLDLAHACLEERMYPLVPHHLGVVENYATRGDIPLPSEVRDIRERMSAIVN